MWRMSPRGPFESDQPVPIPQVHGIKVRRAKTKFYKQGHFGTCFGAWLTFVIGALGFALTDHALVAHVLFGLSFVSGVPTLRIILSYYRWSKLWAALVYIGFALATFLLDNRSTEAGAQDILGSIRQIVHEEALRALSASPRNSPSPASPGTNPSPDRTAAPSHPPAANNGRLRLIFKDSPALTAGRQITLSNNLNSFYDYLTSLGFKIPSDHLPPLGVNAVGSAQGGTFPGDPTYSYSIGIGIDVIDKPETVSYQYAYYWFSNIIDTHVTAGQSSLWVDRSAMTAIIAAYYSHSKWNSTPKPDRNSYHGWTDLLWQMRQEFGKAFMDRAVFFSVGAPEAKEVPFDPEAKELDNYLYHRLQQGINVIDNDGTHGRRLAEILKSRNMIN
jgi:hypothetical protein